MFNYKIAIHITFPNQGWYCRITDRYCRNERAALWLKNTLVLYTFEQMVRLSTGSVAWLIALDLPFFCFIWVRSGKPCPHRYTNIWIVNKTRIWNVKPCLIVWSGFLELSQNVLRRNSNGCLDLNLENWLNF